MRKPLRVAAALLALIALSAYFAESVMAAWCLPGVETAASAEAVAPAGHTAMHHGGTPVDAPEPQHSGSGVPACPFGMTGSGTSCVAVPLPAVREGVRAAPATESTLLPVAVRSPAMLLVTSHFRPPRA